MFNYIQTQENISIDYLISNDYKFSVYDNKQIIEANNGKKLKYFIEETFINSNIKSEYYINRSNYKLITNKDLYSHTFLINENSLQSITPKGYTTKNSFPLKKGDIIFGNNGTIGDIGIIFNKYNVISNSNVTIIRLKNIFNRTYYYLIGLLSSNYIKELSLIKSTKSGTQKFLTRDTIEDFNIPFPTINNNSNPEYVEKLVSLMVQNLIDKEENIKIKNKEINSLIEQELDQNQKGNKYKPFQFPKISDIKENGRLDTRLYGEKFKNFINKIENYKYGYFIDIESIGYKYRKGPNLAISVSGNSIYSKTNTYGTMKNLILSKHIDEYGCIKELEYIGNKSELPILEDETIMLFARGEIGRTYFIDKNFIDYGTSNFDVFFITSNEKEKYEKIFLMQYLKYLGNINFWDYFGVNGSGANSLTSYHMKNLLIPNFPKEKQKIIAKKYYNKIAKNNELELDNYLEKEKERNLELGMFQLNIEIFQLREKLNNIIHKIIMDKKIEIDLNY